MLKAANLALCLLLVSDVVFAQPAPAPVPSQSPPPAIDLRVQQRSNLTPKEMQDGATEYRTRISGVVTRIETLLKEARDQKDIIRINCLQDKLIQARASSGVAEKAFTTMQDGIAKADRGASFHEFTRITIVNQSVQVLAGEAETCVGEELSYVGATRVDVEAPAGPDPNPPDPTPADPDRPPAATPYI